MKKMKFRTELEILPSKIAISHETPILTIGSCFAENIAKKLKGTGFIVNDNPFGVLYNPASIYNSILLAEKNIKFSLDDLIYYQGEYHSFFHHSIFSHHDSYIVLEKLNSGIADLRKFLEKTKFVLVSLGTSFVYKHLEKDIIVSNCHKIPQKEFVRYRLSVEEVISYLQGLIKLLFGFNDEIFVLFTVSPVRHLKDGAIENNRSKSILLLAIEAINSQLNNTGYFPSYELLLDDLRDYRFYNTDMIHPSTEAIDYIWEKFSETFFSAETKDLCNKIEKIKTARAHVVRNPGSDNYQKFVKTNIIAIENLLQTYPFLPIEDDLYHFSKIFDSFTS